MHSEQKIFERYTPNFNKLLDFGFIKEKNDYLFEKDFFNHNFNAKISVSSDGKVTGTVFDIENNDEFLPLRIKSQQGSFVSSVRTSYQQILINIRENCFNKKYFIYEQSNRITHQINSKYNVTPEFLWGNLDGTGVFRNKETKKWFGIIMNVDKSKIVKDKKGIVEVLNVKQEKKLV